MPPGPSAAAAEVLLTLKVRLAALTMMLLVCTMAIVLTFVYATERINLLERVRQERSSALGKLARISQATLDAKEEKILLSYLDAWMETDEAREVGLWDLTGRVHIHSRFLKKDYSFVANPPPPDAFVQRANASEGIVAEAASRDGKRVLRMAIPVSSGGRRFGSAVVDYDAEALDREIELVLNGVLRKLALIALIALGVGLVASWVYATNLTRPIEALGRAAREIGTGKFDAAVDVRRADELGRLAQDLKRMAHQLQELDQMKDRFLQAISHNMRSPLAATASAAYHARQLAAEIPPTVEEDLRVIEAGIRELTRFVNNLLDLERMRAGRMEFKFRSTDLVVLLDEHRQLYERLAEEKGIRLLVQPPSSAVNAFCDPNLIGEVVSNLLVNALKFTPAGGSVTLHARTESESARVTVRDTGLGIPADQLSRLFGRFQQIQGEGRARGGSGLGLALCKEFVEAHGGKIWVESASGEGTSFHFTLPVSGPEAAKQRETLRTASQ